MYNGRIAYNLSTNNSIMSQSHLASRKAYIVMDWPEILFLIQTGTMGQTTFLPKKATASHMPEGVGLMVGLMGHVVAEWVQLWVLH